MFEGLLEFHMWNMFHPNIFLFEISFHLYFFFTPYGGNIPIVATWQIRYHVTLLSHGNVSSKIFERNHVFLMV